jgi:VanZ like family/Concanavalin A-like lectin/glucanases superfamily
MAAQIHDSVTRIPTAHRKRIIAGFCILIAVGILVCTLWPFDFLPANRVSWLSSPHGLRFENHGVVVSDKRIDSLGAQAVEGPCTLEIWIKPARVNSVFSILDIFEPGNQHRFRLQQYESGLIVVHNAPDANGQPARAKVDVNDALVRGRAAFITITSDTDGTTVYLDGKRKSVYPYFKLSMRDFSGRIALGTSAFHQEMWPGEIYALAIYPEAFTGEEVASSFEDWMKGTETTVKSHLAVARYSFAENAGKVVRNRIPNGLDLTIPETFHVPEHSFLTAPWREFDASWTYFWDVLRNIAGFMPFGFFICALLYASGRSRHAIFWSALLGAALSLSVEFLQAYIPQRESGITDIITNTTGTALGSLLMRSKVAQRLLGL